MTNAGVMIFFLNNFLIFVFEMPCAQTEKFFEQFLGFLTDAQRDEKQVIFLP